MNQKIDMSGLEQHEELYHIELRDNWRLLEITARMVLDVLDGHLIPLYGN